MSCGVVYIHSNIHNGKVYVGQTKNLDQRNQGHQSLARQRHRHPFYSALRKYGWDGFDHQIVAEANTQEEINNLERLWIIVLRSTDRAFGYNIFYGGITPSHTVSSKTAISRALKGKKKSAIHRHHMSLSKIGMPAWNKGKILPPLTTQHRDKVSLALRDIHRSTETRTKMSVSKTGKPFSDAHKQSLRKAWIIRKLRQQIKIYN